MLNGIFTAFFVECLVSFLVKIMFRLEVFVYFIHYLVLDNIKWREEEKKTTKDMEEQRRYSSTYSMCVSDEGIVDDDREERSEIKNSPKMPWTKTIPSNNVIVLLLLARFIFILMLYVCSTLFNALTIVVVGWYSRQKCHCARFLEPCFWFCCRVHRLLIMSTICAYHQWACITATWK